MSEKYSIEVDGFTAAISAFVAQFRTHNPSVGEVRCTCHDGSRVIIKFGEGLIETGKLPLREYRHDPYPSEQEAADRKSLGPVSTEQWARQRGRQCPSCGGGKRIRLDSGVVAICPECEA